MAFPMGSPSSPLAPPLPPSLALQSPPATPPRHLWLWALVLQLHSGFLGTAVGPRTESLTVATVPGVALKLLFFSLPSKL